MVKYNGRKKYSQKDAENLMESTMQMITTNDECIMYWKSPKYGSRSDKLIEALTNKNVNEMIGQAEKQNEYLYSKFEYLKKFSPEYTLKGSFGIL